MVCCYVNGAFYNQEPVWSWDANVDAIPVKNFSDVCWVRLHFPLNVHPTGIFRGGGHPACIPTGIGVHFLNCGKRFLNSSVFCVPESTSQTQQSIWFMCVQCCMAESESCDTRFVFLRMTTSSRTRCVRSDVARNGAEFPGRASVQGRTWAGSISKRDARIWDWLESRTSDHPCWREDKKTKSQGASQAEPKPTDSAVPQKSRAHGRKEKESFGPESKVRSQECCKVDWPEKKTRVWAKAFHLKKHQ